MSISYPTSLDNFSNPSAGNPLNSPSHSTQHANENDAIEALEAKVGIDGSAVTTSHDYKLSGVTGSDKAVSKTGTETLTNKTLTSPVINVSSDATGDMYYRNSSGIFTRLSIGSASQILQVSISGIPEWIANPSTSDASTTVKGVVEEATSAEITSGTSTGGTGAELFINPAQLAGSAPTFSGANLTNIASAIIFKNGSFTRAGDTASGTQTIAHGAGKIPKFIRIDSVWFNGSGNNISATSNGCYNGTTTSCAYLLTSSSATPPLSAVDSTNIINLNQGASLSQVATVSVDITNITLTWTRTGSTTSTNMACKWEIIA